MEPTSVELGRLYVAFLCKHCNEDFPVHLLRATFEDPEAMMRCRPPCPRCDRAGILHKGSRVFASFDGAKADGVTEGVPYLPPEPTEPKRKA